jgi:RNA polymerase sigma-54 factor
MDLSPKLHANFQQKLILTQRMQQSLRILQLSQLELGALIAEEIEKNPLLEIESERFPCNSNSQKYDPSFPDIIDAPSLDEHVVRQIRQVFNSSHDQAKAEELAGQLDEKGFLSGPLTAEQEQLLPVLQTLSPSGIFARSCQEGFIIQLEHLGLKGSIAHTLVTNCYEDLLQKRFGKIEKKIPCSTSQLTKAIHMLSRLSMRPAATFRPVPCQPLYPDLQVIKVNKKWMLSPIEDALPKFRIQTDYQHLKGLPKEQKQILNGFRSSAKWLEQSIERRRELLFQLASYLIKCQTAYLNNEGPLTTISPAELATIFGVHESTISRALADKYIESPLGIIPLNSLISTLGTDPAKQLLQRLILQENKQNPLTDDQLAAMLKKLGYSVARRTVAKYRLLCKIRSAKTRKYPL